MAGGAKGRGAFWLGGLLGLVVSASLAIALSVLAPMNDGEDGAESEQAAERDRLILSKT